MKFTSRLGWILAGIYLLFTLVIVVYALTCKELYCGFALVVPVMPWPLIFQGGGISPPSSPALNIAFYVFIVCLNAAILYGCGWLVGKAFRRG